ncbi:MAG TPA: PPC domain-containing protein [Gemmatimonadales bacterium]|nr:PPC domain-containing protein [Gemmatimonadales bacterium]
MSFMTRGPAVLGMILVAACGGDPLADEGEELARLVATPTALFVNQGESEEVIVEGLNATGTPAPVDRFAVATADASVLAQIDPNYEPTTGSPIRTRARIVITGVSPAASTVTVTGGGATLGIPVRVVPTTLAAQVSNPAPAAGEQITLTAPPGLTFGPEAVLAFASGDSGVTLARSEDGTTLTVLPPLGASGGASVSDVRPAYAPEVPLELPLTTDITVGSAVTPIGGTGAPGTAPSVVVPSSGGVTAFYDAGSWAGDCDGVPCQWYRIEVGDAADLDFGARWDNQADLGIYVFEGDAATLVGACDDHANGADAQPEACTITLPAAGTYYVTMQNFAPFYPDPDPTYFLLQIAAP